MVPRKGRRRRCAPVGIAEGVQGFVGRVDNFEKGSVESTHKVPTRITFGRRARATTFSTVSWRLRRDGDARSYFHEVTTRPPSRARRRYRTRTPAAAPARLPMPRSTQEPRSLVNRAYKNARNRREHHVRSATPPPSTRARMLRRRYRRLRRPPSCIDRR